jgi:diadenosine tetraphosphate (Ap4A) HIT family hydrolase
MVFTLHPALEQDLLFVKQLPLSMLFLMNDSRFPWLVLVPKRANISEIYELDIEEQTILFSEISFVGKMLKSTFHADKLNFAALGNVVPQLHIHLIARFQVDMAWPSPVWGFEKAIPYTTEQSLMTIDLLNQTLNANTLTIDNANG